MSPGPFIWKIPISSDPQNPSKYVNIKFTSDRFIVLPETSPFGRDTRHLSASIRNAKIKYYSFDNAMPVSETQEHCIIMGNGIICEFENVK